MSDSELAMVKYVEIGGDRDGALTHDVERQRLDIGAVGAWQRTVELEYAPGKTSVLECGNGDPALILDSADGECADWALLLTELKEDLHMYVVAGPGLGRPPFEYRDPALRSHAARFVSSVLDALGIRSATIIGGTTGSFFAISAALEVPDRVRDIVLLGSPAALVGPGASGMAMREASHKRLAAIERLHGSERAIVLAAHGDGDIGISRMDARLANRGRRIRMAGLRRGQSNLYLGEDAVGVRQPTMLASGPQDLSYLRRVASRMPDCQFQVLGRDEPPYLEVPRETADLIREFRRDRSACAFRAFDEEYFVESPAWRRLRTVLGTNGGAYALAGPRGAGKSWLMLRALSHARRMGGIALWYPCPSNYSVFEFLSTLSDNFANEIERRYRPDRLYPTLASSPWRVAVGAALVALGIVLAWQEPADYEFVRVVGIVGLAGTLAAILWALSERSRPGARPTQSPAANERPSALARLGKAMRQRPAAGRFARWYAALALILMSGYLVYWGVAGGSAPTGNTLRVLVLATVALSTGFLLLVLTLRAVAREREPERLLTREAALLRERIRYSSRTKEANEMSARGGLGGIFAGLKAAREKELVERPTTVASLIQDFRALAERAAQVSGRVVIAIDELDKIADAVAVRALLRDIKGIFEIKGVFFLVSVSDEATRSLRLGGIAGRDEFNSSFYAVIDVPPMDDDFLHTFFVKRGTPLAPRVARALSVLAGNNPRETLRIADAILRADAGFDIERAVSSAVLAEVQAFRTHAMTSTAPGWRDGLGDDARNELAETLDDARFNAGSFAPTARDLAHQWSPDWGQYWTRYLQDQWRRLLIRILVAAETLKDDADLQALADILRGAEDSPVVARRTLRERGWDGLHLSDETAVSTENVD